MCRFIQFQSCQYFRSNCHFNWIEESSYFAKMTFLLVQVNGNFQFGRYLIENNYSCANTPSTMHDSEIRVKGLITKRVTHKFLESNSNRNQFFFEKSLHSHLSETWEGNQLIVTPTTGVAVNSTRANCRFWNTHPCIARIS